MDNSSLFVKGKGPILTEYLRTRKKLGDAVAGRGFSFEPGFMYDAQNELEIDVKGQLSTLNYQLLEQAIAQDLKRNGLDYDLAFKNAAIAWELDKQDLLTDWDRELMSLKRAQVHEDELLNLLAVEVSKRANVLLAAKTAIDLEAEAIRLQIAELDGTTSEYELQLANAKLATAQKKLKIIPIMQQIVGIEEGILAKELEIVGKAWLLVDKAKALVDKEEEILNKNQQIATKQKDILAAEQDVLSAEEILVEDLKEKVADEAEFITSAKDTAQSIIDLLTPALTSLIAKMEDYILELVVQQDLTAQIAAKKMETSAVRTAIAEGITGTDGILDKKQDIADAMTELIALNEGLIEYKETKLSPLLSELIEVYRNYSEDVLTAMGVRAVIAQTQMLVKRLELDRAAKEALVSAAEVAKQTQITALHAAELANKTTIAGNRVIVATQKTTDATALSTAEDTSRASIVTKEDNSFNNVKRIKETYQSTKINAQLADATSLETTRQAEERLRANAWERKENSMTDIKINTDITAKLTHLLT